jgi:LPS-assembly protein
VIIISRDDFTCTYFFMNLRRMYCGAYIGLTLMSALPIRQVQAADTCPNPELIADRRGAPTAAIDPKTPIDASADSLTYAPNGDVQLDGNVEVRQGERTLRAPRIEYSASGTLRIPGAVELSDPQLVLRGQRATVETEGAAEFADTEFELPARAGRGSAEHIRLSQDGELTLHGTRYTTCPVPEPDWELKVDKLHIDADARVGTARNARVEFQGVPIFYTPYISFPVGSERKSGLLFPTPGQSGRGGFELAVPWYWNIAPNQDATFTPTWFSKRGIDLGGEYRFLTERHHGILQGNYLPSDSDAGRDRSYIEVNTRSDFTERWRLTTGGANVSDIRWFEDFGTSLYNSSTVVQRWAELRYRDDAWSVLARAQNYQIIDREIPLENRPYTLLPHVAVQGYFPDRLLGLTAVLDADYVAFTRNNDGLADDIRGQRYSAAPELRLPLRGNSMYIEPAASWNYIGYRISSRDDMAAIDPVDRSPSVSAPVFSVDSGMVFERSSGRSAQRIQTLEPRAVYLYVPYRDQDAMPVFDTGRPDLNLTQLFRNQRYVGGDRIGDANQLAYGITSRLLDAGDGRQYISATLGQRLRFATPRVTIPGDAIDVRDNSDIIGELSLTAYRNWNARIGYQWDPETQRSERTEFAFQYLPGPGKVINVGYRFRNPITNTRGVKQADASFAWPVGANFSTYALVVYSLQERTATEQFAGLEYRSCCWNMRLVAGRSLVTRSGEYDTWYKWQLELKGLSSVGNGDAFLSQMIRGYSAARFDINSTP